MSTRFILTHPYFPQSVYRFRHIWHRAHARVGVVSKCSMGLFWRRYRVFYWLLRACVGNWVKVRPPKPTVQFDDTVPVPNAASKWSMMKRESKVSKPVGYASLKREI